MNAKGIEGKEERNTLEDFFMRMGESENAGSYSTSEVKARSDLNYLMVRQTKMDETQPISQ